ncbi:GNAT family N-acetyltransferase [Rathayibacter soli]|uniref:GNAT family N-acetyltransferase n=1 Tax=Rathayibacter soli TaxID=3144168 RepID=UPI0027E4F5B2|nr:N-acetyltransferase [Glaciibacter superstes]
MPVTVRTAGSADAAQLAEVAAITFPLACPPGSTAEAQAAFIADVLSEACFAEYLADRGRIVLVAEEEADRTILGYTMLVFLESRDPDVLTSLRIHPTAELSKCYVLPGQHGTGVAGALMTASLEAARQRGAAGIWLGVNEENTRAHRFYLKHGFERVGTKHFRLGDNVEGDFVMEREL